MEYCLLPTPHDSGGSSGLACTDAGAPLQPQSPAITQATSPSQLAPLLRHRHLLCKHGVGLHPQVARKGKLLSRDMYDAYVSLLVSEREELLREKGVVVVTSDCGGFILGGEKGGSDCVNDCVITPDSNLYCRECACTYRAEVECKIRAMELIVELHDALEGCDNNVNLVSACERESEDDGHIYAISRSFISGFRKYATRKMKEATVAAGQSSSVKRGKKSSDSGDSPGSRQSFSVFDEGIDLLDLDDIPSVCTLSFLSNSSEVENVVYVGKDDSRSNDCDEILDPYVNSKITCESQMLW